MVQLRVREIANERGVMTITALAEKAGLAYDTARDLWHGRMQRIDRDVLGRVCEALDCGVADLMVYDGELTINSSPYSAGVPV